MPKPTSYRSLLRFCHTIHPDNVHGSVDTRMGLLMTSEHRLRMTLQGGHPDRIPAFTPTFACQVASRLLHRSVHTGSPSLWYAEACAWIQGSTAFREFEVRLEEDIVELYTLLNQDVIRFPWRQDTLPTRQIDAETFVYGDPEGEYEIWRWDADTFNFIRVRSTRPVIAPEDWWTVVREAEQTLESRLRRERDEFARREARLQKRLQDMVVVVTGAPLSLGLDEVSLMACVLQPDAVSALLDIQLEIAFVQVETAAKRGIRYLLGGADLADKNGPLYAPERFDSLILPRLCRLADYCQSLGVHYIWRTDGRIWPLMNSIFNKANVPGYGEVDRDAGMTVGEIRRRYPHVSLWANMSGDCLRRATPQQVFSEAQQIIEESQGTRYIHGCSNTILSGTPVENVWAMLDVL